MGPEDKDGKRKTSNGSIFMTFEFESASQIVDLLINALDQGLLDNDQLPDLLKDIIQKNEQLDKRLRKHTHARKM